jgi:hypothetical protein
MSDIQRELEQAIRGLAEVEAGVQAFAEEVRDHARSEAPVRTGAYAASIEVRKADPVNGLPARKVVATDWKAHFIEFGTGEPGPTTEHAPMGKTAHHFGGTLDGGVTAE